MALSPQDAAKVLAVAATFDPRLRPPSPEDARARATAWASVLHERMTVEWAVRAVGAHYASETTMLMPAHLNAQHRLHRDREREEGQRAQRALQPANAVPMPPAVRGQIQAVLSGTKVPPRG